MWTTTLIAAAILGGLALLNARAARRDLDILERDACEQFLTLRLEIERMRRSVEKLQQPRDTKTGRYIARISTELDAMLTEAEEAAQLDSAS